MLTKILKGLASLKSKKYSMTFFIVKFILIFLEILDHS